MTWVVAVSNRAQKNLSRARAADERRILAALDAMQINPLSRDVVNLAGQDAFRRRVGNYRNHFAPRLRSAHDRHRGHQTADDNHLPINDTRWRNPPTSMAGSPDHLAAALHPLASGCQC
jgi:hypothetical protein